MGKHRSMAYFPVLTGRDEMSKQARFVVRMALACHEAGTPYDLEWKYRWVQPEDEDKGVYYARPSDRPAPLNMPGCSVRLWYARLTAEGNLPMPKPFPKAPKVRTVATWKPNVFAEASYRVNVGLDRDKKPQSGWIVEHSSGLSLVKFGQSDTGELTADDTCEPMDGWYLTHTASLRGWGVKGKFSKMVQALQFAAPFMDWRKSADELAQHPDWQRIGLTVMAEHGPHCESDKARLESMGGPIERPSEPTPPTTPAPAVRTRTTKPVDAISSKLAENEARIAAIKAQLAKPADEVQARLNRLLAELKANRPQAPAGKLAVTYPDGRVAYIPDPAAERRVSA